jgi:hypothetical protein
MSQETVAAAQDMMARFGEWHGRNPESTAADATYGNGEFLHWSMERGTALSPLHECVRVSPAHLALRNLLGIF